MLQHKILKAMALLVELSVISIAVLLSGCGGGGDNASNAVAPSNQVSTPEARLAKLLAVDPVTRSPEISPLSGEVPFLNQEDQKLTFLVGSRVVANRYGETISRLADRAKLSSLNAFVVSDLACTSSPAGGGLASSSVLYLDGKLLDMMAEIANALALVEAGKLTANISQIVDAAAVQQLSFSKFCAPSDPSGYPDSMLTQDELRRSVEIFTQMAGGILFHEFGHVWGRHTLLRLRESAVYPQGGFFAYTSTIEDNADVIAGILSAKSKHDPIYPKLWVDLMMFTYLYRKAPGSVFFDQALSWQSQYQQLAPNYSSAAARKALVGVGYQGWADR